MRLRLGLGLAGLVSFITGLKHEIALKFIEIAFEILKNRVKFQNFSPAAQFVFLICKRSVQKLYTCNRVPSEYQQTTESEMGVPSRRDKLSYRVIRLIYERSKLAIFPNFIYKSVFFDRKQEKVSVFRV